MLVSTASHSIHIAVLILFACSLIGVIGILAMTWLFPLSASLYARLCSGKVSPIIQGRRRYSIGSQSESAEEAGEWAESHFTVIIPAHDDANGLQRTLISIRSAVERAARLFPELRVLLVVGLDGCTDNSADIARRNGAVVHISDRRIGKWAMLERLLSVADCKKWTIFADCGAEWPIDFFEKIIPLCLQEDALAVAPTFEERLAGYFIRFSWRLERCLKSFENVVGGPVSVHGATVVYRTSAVRGAFGWLERTHSEDNNWLNDDVVLPLAIRALYPSGSIIYAPEIVVTDSGAQTSRNDGQRRLRMIEGNMQWMVGLLPAVFQLNFTAALLALRRVFRVFWAYWLGAVLAAPVIILVAIGYSLTASVLSVMVVASVAGYRARLVRAVRASVCAPIVLFRRWQRGREAQVAWR